MERVNDKDLDMMAKAAGDVPHLEAPCPFKDDNELPKPVIVNTPKLDFAFNSVRKTNG